MADSVHSEQQLVLRVMRLARPKFNEPICLPVDPADPLSVAIGSSVKAMTGQDDVAFPIGSYLMAPQSMEVVYLGETFTFYVVLVNEGRQMCSDICIKADIQTQTQRFNLTCSLQEVNALLEPGKMLGEIITHEIKEVGQHILVVAVTYKAGDGAKAYFRKFFKFPVQKPIDVRTKYYNSDDNMNHEVYPMEAQIQNLCSSAIILERVTLEPSELYDAKEVCLQPSSQGVGEGGGEQQEHVYLEPGATYQYLYCLSPKLLDSVHHYRGVSPIGRLDMQWRTAMGERGRLQTSTLQRMAPGHGDIRLTIEKIPRKVKCEEPFQVACKLLNCCERSLDLTLTLDDSLQTSVVFCSVSGLHLGQVAPNGNVQFTLDVLPIATGLQYISGIRLTDSLLRRTYEYDEIAQVLIR